MRHLCLVSLLLVATTPSLADTVKFVFPTDTGTVRYFPFLNVLDKASVGTEVQSVCNDSISINLEWRRGFMEFAVPSFRHGVTQATLVITAAPNGHSPGTPPPDTHEVSYYPGNLAVEASDFDAPTTLLGTFVTEHNDTVTRTFRFDVTDIVSQAQGGALGFRVKLQIDPLGPCPENAGRDFGDLIRNTPRLEIVAKGLPVRH